MQLKVISLNIWNGGTLWESVLSFIKEQQADIYLFQEVYNGHDDSMPPFLKSMDGFVAVLPEYNFVFAPIMNNERPEGTMEVGNAVFSKLPIIGQQVTFFDVGFGTYKNAESSGDYDQQPKNLQHVEIQAEDKVLNIFNTHGVWGKDGLDNPKRENMGRVIVDQIAGKENVMLAGDFNLLPTTQVVKNIEHHLVNVFKDELSTTFNMKQKSGQGYATSVVDMMFVSSDMRVLKHDCPAVDVSDHLPLIVTLLLPPSYDYQT